MYLMDSPTISWYYFFGAELLGVPFYKMSIYMLVWVLYRKEIISRFQIWIYMFGADAEPPAGLLDPPPLPSNFFIKMICLHIRVGTQSAIDR